MIKNKPMCDVVHCPWTLGVCIGAGRYLCWAHLLKQFGSVGEELWKCSPHVGLKRFLD